MVFTLTTWMLSDPVYSIQLILLKIYLYAGQSTLCLIPTVCKLLLLTLVEGGAGRWG